MRTGTGRTRRGLPSWAIAIATLLGFPILCAIFGLPLYVFPPSDAAESADVVYVIGPPYQTRVDFAQDLLLAGAAQRMLISVGPPGAAFDAESIPACMRESVDCLSPVPFTTEGEALALAQTADVSAGSRVIVVTAVPHVARTRYIFEKCFGHVDVVGLPVDLDLLEWAHQYIYQSGAFVKAWISSCD